MIMPSDAECETLLVRVVQLLRERLLGRSSTAVRRTGRAARGERAKAVEATGAAVLRQTLGKAWRHAVASGLLLLWQLLVGTVSILLA